MINTTGLCTLCVEVMSNPLCSSCFSKHVTFWLSEKNLPKHEVLRIKKLLKRFVNSSEETPFGSECIICGSKIVNICTVCSMEKVKRIIENVVEDEVLIEDFDENFNPKIWEFPTDSWSHKIENFKVPNQKL